MNTIFSARRLRTGLLLVMIGSLLFTGITFGDAPSSRAIPQIYVKADDSLVITVPNVTRVAVGDPTVVDATITSPDEVLVHGLAFNDWEELETAHEDEEGDTTAYIQLEQDHKLSNLYVWSNNQRYIYNVIVYDPQSIPTAFNWYYTPKGTTANLKIEVEPTGLIVSGEVGMDEIKNSIMDYLTSRNLNVIQDNIRVENLYDPTVISDVTEPYTERYLLVTQHDIRRALINKEPIVGMTRDQVESILGDPIRPSEMVQDANGRILERSFYRKNIVFYYNDRAVKVQEPYYGDIDFDAETATKMIPVYLRPASDFQEILTNIYGADNVTVQVDEASNTILLRGSPDDVVNMIDTITALDNRTAQQVLIEARFVELSRSANNELGVAWGLGAQNPDGNQLGVDFNANAGLSAQPGYADPSSDFNGGLRFGTIDATTGKFSAMTLQDLDMVISALESKGNAEILSSPRIVTLNNQAAQLQSIRKVYDRIVTESRNDQGQPTFSQELIEREVGITLDVLPTIGRDGVVTMKLEPKVSVLVGTIPPNPGANDPIINVIDERNTNSVVMLRSGTTLVIGGLLSRTRRDDTEKVPLLGSIPVLGRLFRSDTSSDDTIDLVIFLTAQIIPPDGSLPAVGTPVRTQTP